MLLAEVGTVLRLEVRLGAQPSFEFNRNLGLHAGRPRAGLQAPDDVEPVQSRTIQERILPVERRLGGQRQPEIWRIGPQAVPEKPRRGNPGYSVGHLVDREGGANHRRIEPEVPPGAVAHHDYRRGAWFVILQRDSASGGGADTERGKVIAGDEFAHVGLSWPGRPAAADAQAGQASLEGGHLAEFRRVIAELLV